MTVMPLVRPDSSATAADDCSEFYARYRQPLLAYVAVGFPSVDAENIVQETFCRVLAHWGEVGQMRNPWPWLAVTARNLARNSVRDNANVRSIGLAVEDSASSSAPELDEVVQSYDTLRKLGRAMRALTPLQRQLLRLLVEEGLSGADAARRLGLSPGAGRMHLCRMRTRLAERFVGLGGQLAVTPFALLAMFGRRLRGLFSASRKTMVAGAPGVLASTLAIATTLGVVHIGIAKSHNGFRGNHAVHISTANARAASFNRAGQPASRATTAGTALDRQQASPMTIHAAPALPESHHVMIRKDPTKAGKNVDAGVTITTPAGSHTVALIGTQSQHSALRRICKAFAGGVCTAS